MKEMYEIGRSAAFALILQKKLNFRARQGFLEDCLDKSKLIYKSLRPLAIVSVFILQLPLVKCV